MGMPKYASYHSFLSLAEIASMRQKGTSMAVLEHVLGAEKASGLGAISFALAVNCRTT